MNEIEQRLWANVYASEYARLSEMAARDHRPGSYVPAWEQAGERDGARIEKYAQERADEAVHLLQVRTGSRT
jgi:hypothetical protein